ncbi:MAG: heme-binding protein [Akkermansiaceae bacterium]
MNYLFLVSCVLLTACSAADEENPSYQSDAPLPKGWPQPGPYNEVAEKEYPAYRAAFTIGNRSNGSFWTLFRHIQKKDIPMTAPVEMTMDEKGGEMEMVSMGFLYQDTTVGTKGRDGEKVEVRDVPKAKVLSYTWMGSRNEQSMKVAKEALEKVLAEKKLKATGFRVLGYNGPMTPRKKQTHELQALLK